VGGPSSVYFGPLPKPAHPGLNGATLCRSNAHYGTAYGALVAANGHLDTDSECGAFHDVPAGAQPEAYPAGAGYPSSGYPLNAGDVVRLHSEYENGTGATVPDVMGIMTLWVASRPQGASPLKLSLVPALRQTISGTQCQARGGSPSSHGAPLSFTSCNPPSFVPGTIGWVGDRSTGSATVVSVPGDPATPANDADLV